MVELLAKVCCIGAATVRNLLFDNCKHADLLSTFRSRLKTKLFHIAYHEQQHTYHHKVPVVLLQLMAQ